MQISTKHVPSPQSTPHSCSFPTSASITVWMVSMLGRRQISSTTLSETFFRNVALSSFVAQFEKNKQFKQIQKTMLYNMISAMFFGTMLNSLKKIWSNVLYLPFGTAPSGTESKVCIAHSSSVRSVTCASVTNLEL